MRHNTIASEADENATRLQPNSRNGRSRPITWTRYDNCSSSTSIRTIKDRMDNKANHGNDNRYCNDTNHPITVTQSMSLTTSTQPQSQPMVNKRASNNKLDLLPATNPLYHQLRTTLRFLTASMRRKALLPLPLTSAQLSQPHHDHYHDLHPII